MPALSDLIPNAEKPAGKTVVEMQKSWRSYASYLVYSLAELLLASYSASLGECVCIGRIVLEPQFELVSVAFRVESENESQESV